MLSQFSMTLKSIGNDIVSLHSPTPSVVVMFSGQIITGLVLSSMVTGIVQMVVLLAQSENENLTVCNPLVSSAEISFSVLSCIESPSSIWYDFLTVFEMSISKIMLASMALPAQILLMDKTGLPSMILGSNRS